MPSRRRPQSEAPTPQSDGPQIEKDVQKPAVPFWSLHNRRSVIIFVAVGTFLLLLALGLGLGLGLGLKDRCEHDNCSTKNHKGANVLVIMTDDQDMLLDSMSAMPNVTKLIGGEGVTYQKHYCSTAWCCPSRVNFLTGRAAHNTNVTSTGPPYGGWQKFTEQGLNDNYLPVWINNSGIKTYYIGKLLNGYSKKNLAKPAHPKGWTNSSFLVDPWTYNYYHGHWTNGYTDEVTTFKGIHTTDVTQNKSLAMLEDAASSGEQFFMMVAPVAPHQEIAGKTLPPPVPEAFQGMFANETAPRTANWNPDGPSGASWVYHLPKLDEQKINVCDVTHRHRLGNLAAIDAMVAQFIQKLDDHGILDNTYVVYTTDNGFHIGNHRLQPGKRCPYEEDINIPLLIRGPDVAQGVNSTITNSHTDMAPTILQMLGVPLQDNFDGAPIAYTSEQLSSSNKSEMVNVEFWNSGSFTPIGFAHNLYYNNTYKALRLMSGNYSLYYSSWCTGEREFYDMGTDFAQMYNRLGPNSTGISSTYYGRSETDLFDRLDALLMVTKSCKEETCRVPWSALFPDNSVVNLEEAMNPQFDAFFTNQPKVQFSTCADGNIISEEGPQLVNVFSGS